MTAPTTRSGVYMCAELAVLRALEAAGKRGKLPRSQMGLVKGQPTHIVHTLVPLASSSADCERLLSGVWVHLQLVTGGDGRLIAALDWYVRELIVHQRKHTRGELDRVLAVLDAS